ncbi:MAG: J domain-containing protein [Acidimicrobiales bacterium]
MNAGGFGLADFELYHSRPIAPTRRLALGLQYLPASPSPGPGGLLLAGMVATFGASLDEDDQAELLLLMQQVEAGYRDRAAPPSAPPAERSGGSVEVAPPARSRARRSAVPADLGGGIAAGAHPGAVYAAGNLPADTQAAVFNALRKALRWHGGLDAAFVAHISGGGTVPSGWRALGSDPEAWALSVLGFDEGTDPSKRDIRRQYRDALRAAHPDHGGDESEAAQRIAELGEARRILLG